MGLATLQHPRFAALGKFRKFPRCASRPGGKKIHIPAVAIVYHAEAYIHYVWICAVYHIRVKIHMCHVRAHTLWVQLCNGADAMDPGSIKRFDGYMLLRPTAMPNAVALRHEFVGVVYGLQDDSWRRQRAGCPLRQCLRAAFAMDGHACCNTCA